MNYIKHYGFFGFLGLILDVLHTKVFFPGQRIVRRPIYIRGRAHIEFGKNLTTGVGTRIDASSYDAVKKTLRIGNNLQINDYVHIGAFADVEIGHNVLIASKVFISDHNHGSYSGQVHSDPRQAPIDRPLSSKKVFIGDNVWIGEFVSILPGAHIGAGCVIGSGAVVTGEIPPNSIVVGAPGRVVKQYDDVSKAWIRVNNV